MLAVIVHRGPRFVAVDAVLRLLSWVRRFVQRAGGGALCLRVVTPLIGRVGKRQVMLQLLQDVKLKRANQAQQQLIDRGAALRKWLNRLASRHDQSGVDRLVTTPRACVYV